MRELRKWAWTAVVAAAAATPALAQQGTVTTGGGRTTSTLTGTGGLTGGGAGQLGGGTTGGGTTGGGGGLGGGSTGGSGSDLQGSALQTMLPAPKLIPPAGTAASSLHPTNRFAGYSANPYFQGNSLQVNAAPGGFGLPPTGATGAGGRAATGASATVGGGIGGRGAAGGQNASNQSGILIPLPTQIAYTAKMQFQTPPVAVGRIHTDVRAVIDTTPAIANAKAVQVITDADNNVTLRGSVKDDDESRLIEGIVRLTPGVGSIKNELAFPVAGR